MWNLISKLSKMKHTYIVLLALLPICRLAAQESKATTGVFALMNARMETISHGVVTGNLIIRDGKIAAMGPDAAAPAGAQVIDCSGKTIYPGFIDGGTRVGLAEITSIDVTQDFQEVGDLTPQVKALTAVNPNSVIIPVTRVSGITTLITAPRGGIFSGAAALIHLHGYTPDQMYAGYQAACLNFPSSARRGSFDSRSEEDLKKEQEKRLKRLNEIWDEALLYAKLDSAHRAGGPAPSYYPEMAALLPVVKGEIPLMIEVNAAADILSALDWVQARKLKAILTGVAEGWRVADKIAAAGVPVIAGPVLALPTRESDRYDIPYRNPGLLLKAGVKVALRSNQNENTRNLPFHAGFAAAHGMGREAALRAITLTPAEIFGLADRIGSLDVGKEANLFVANGDPFEPATQVSQVFIRGWLMPADTRQTRLYDEFLQRSPGAER
jgi:imidazolonepropionase-like amidohydrolase